jgi:hypothetical protein
VKNKLADLNNHLFGQLEKLCDEKLIGPELEEEISKSRAIVSISSQILKGAKLRIDAMKLVNNGSATKEELTLLIGDKNSK